MERHLSLRATALLGCACALLVQCTERIVAETDAVSAIAVDRPLGQLSAQLEDMTEVGELNVLVFGDYNGGGDVGGGIAAGGNVVLNGFNVGHQSPGGAVIVGHDLTLTNGVLHGDAVHSGAADAGNTVAFNGGTLIAAEPIDFSEGYADVIAGGLQMLALPVDGATNVTAYGTAELVGSQPEINVFEISAADLSGLQSLRIDLPPGASAVINVSGTDVSLANFGVSLGSGLGAQNVMFNMPQVVALELHNGQLRGTVLAPRAAVQSTNAVVEGLLIADSVSGSGAYRYAPFIGDLGEGEIQAVQAIIFDGSSDARDIHAVALTTQGLLTTTGDIAPPATGKGSFSFPLVDVGGDLLGAPPNLSVCPPAPVPPQLETNCEVVTKSAAIQQFALLACLHATCTQGAITTCATQVQALHAQVLPQITSASTLPPHPPTLVQLFTPRPDPYQSTGFEADCATAMDVMVQRMKRLEENQSRCGAALAELQDVQASIQSRVNSKGGLYLEEKVFYTDKANDLETFTSFLNASAATAAAAVCAGPGSYCDPLSIDFQNCPPPIIVPHGGVVLRSSSGTLDAAITVLDAEGQRELAGRLARASIVQEYTFEAPDAIPTSFVSVGPGDAPQIIVLTQLPLEAPLPDRTSRDDALLLEGVSAFRAQLGPDCAIPD